VIAAERKLAFAREQLILADGRTVGDGIRDDPWIEEEVLKPAFEQRQDGLPRKTLLVDELPRGHGKSTYGAGIALTEATLEAGTDVVICAADKDQARIILEHVDAFCSRNAALGGLWRSRGDERLTDVGSRIRVIASDAPTAFGLGGTHRRFRVIADELTAWASDALWVAVASATGKVRDVQVLALTNAGFQPETSWQWKVRETARTLDFGHLYAPDGVVASWISAEWISHMRALLPSAAFDRLISNIWTTGTGDFCTEEQWARCVDERLTPRTRGLGTRHYAGLDLGLTRDRTAFAIVHRDDGEIVLDDLAAWQGTRSDPVSITTIERAVADTAGRFPGLEIHADPWQMRGSIERLQSSRLSIREFNFSSGSVARLSAALHSAISSASLRVYPDDALTREILGLRVIETPSGWRFDHRTGGFSDRAVALAMAVLAAQATRSARMTTSVPRGRIEIGRGVTYADKALAAYAATRTHHTDAALAAIGILKGDEL
jgi:hypothetical protein